MERLQAYKFELCPDGAQRRLMRRFAQEPILQGSLSQFAYSGSPTTGLPAGAPASGAVAGNRMVFASGHYVLAQGY
jgi:hypothetical protein